MQNFSFYLPLEIRYADLDPQGHVNNALYLTYIEQGRIAYITHLGLWDGKTFSKVGIILASAQITFLSPIYLGQPLQVGVRVSRLGGKSLDMEYVIEDSQKRQELARATTVLVAYNYDTHQTISIPENWRSHITEFENLSAE
jgi:acyl-CoA thioester hydrolase